MPQTRWPAARIARMAYMIGRGLDARKIAADPEIQSQPAVVIRYAARMGMKIGDASPHSVDVELEPAAMAAIRTEARLRRQTSAALIGALATICAGDQHLFANILNG